MQGYGIKYYNNGNVFKGNFVNDYEHRYGIMQYKNGDMFKGNFENGLIEGEGVFEFFFDEDLKLDV